jgi:hypothetical protein
MVGECRAIMQFDYRNAASNVVRFSTQRKELTLNIRFNYVDGHNSPQSAGRKPEKRGKSSVTQRMLGERDAQLDVEESTSGGKPVLYSRDEAASLP